MQNKYAAEWIAYGDEDIRVIQLLLNDPSFAHAVCFHAQQAAEKFLKGFLAYHEQNVRKVHDLTILLKQCIEIDSSFATLHEAVEYLNPLYTEARYPGDIEDFSYEEANGAAAMAQRVQQVVMQAIQV